MRTLRAAAVAVTVVVLAACAGDAGGPAPGGGEVGGEVGGGGAGRDETAGGTLALDTVAQGAQGPRLSGEVVARSAEEWARAWSAHEGPGPAPEPGVDFSRDMLVAVFQGQKPSAGYSVQVQEVRRAEDATHVRYQRSSPRPGCLTASVLTAPFHVVAVERVAGDVGFTAEDRAEAC